MIFAVDIDGTISSANAEDIYQFFIQELGLDIPARTIETLPTFGAFLHLPQVAQFRQANERLFLSARHKAIETPGFLLALVPMPLAAQELHYLTSLGEVRYCTARAPEVKGVTQQWLEQHGFPCYHHVECCSTIAQKVQTLASYQPAQEPIVLIDDRGHTDMLDALQKTPDIASRLSILAFGVSDVPVSTTFFLRALPAWSHVREVIASLPHSGNQWELGNVQPYPYNLGQLCQFFGKEPDDLDLAPTQTTLTVHTFPDLTQYDAENPDIFELIAQTVTDEQQSELLRQIMNKKVSRRQVLAILGASGSILIAPSLDVLPRMAGEILPFCETNILQCWELSKGDLPHMLKARQAISSYIPPLTELAKQSSRDQSRAAHLASQCYRLRSLLAYHTENLAIAEQYSTQAIAFSELTEDVDLHVILLTHAALVDYYAKQPLAALNHCRQVKPYKQRASHAVQSKLFRVQAACEAQIDGLEDKARQSLNLADKHYNLHMAANASSSVFEDDAKTFELQLWQGITLRHLGDPAAIATLESAKPFEAALPERVRTGIIDNLLFAELQGPAKKRDMERLVLRWQEAQRRANELQSKLRQDEVRQAYEGLLVAFPGEQRIRSLHTATST